MLQTHHAARHTPSGMDASLVFSRIHYLIYINIKRNIRSEHLYTVAKVVTRISSTRTCTTVMDFLCLLNRQRRWIVAWFFLSLGAALAAPMVQARTMELVCTGGNGLSLVVHSSDGKAAPDTLGMDCPLCLLGASAPPPVRPLPQAAPLPHYTFAPPSVAHALPPMAAPPPARAPPVFPSVYPS